MCIRDRDKKLSRAEKRLAEQSYAHEQRSKITYSRPSYAAFYPKDPGASLSNLHQPGSNGFARNNYQVEKLKPWRYSVCPLVPGVRFFKTFSSAQLVSLKKSRVII